MNLIHHTITLAGAQTDDASVVGVVAVNHSTGRRSPQFDGTSKRATGDTRNPGLGEAIATYRALKALLDDWEAGIHLMAGGHCEGVGDPKGVVAVPETNANAAQEVINAAIAVVESKGKSMLTRQVVNADAIDDLEDALEALAATHGP